MKHQKSPLNHPELLSESTDHARKIDLLRSIAERLSDKTGEGDSSYKSEQLNKCLHHAKFILSELGASTDHLENHTIVDKTQRLISDLDQKLEESS